MKEGHVQTVAIVYFSAKLKIIKYKNDKDEHNIPKTQTDSCLAYV